MTRREEIARLVERLRNDGVVRSSGIFEDAASALTQQEAEIARLREIVGDDQVRSTLNAVRTERDELQRKMDEFSKHRGWSLSFDCKMFCEDDNPDLWTVFEEGGNRNDREWTAIGRGSTVLEAITAALSRKDEGQ